MADKKRLGRQIPTSEFTLLEAEHDTHLADEAIGIYNTEKCQAMEWQEHIIKNIMATDSEGLWVHSKVGYSVPRRNGKGEILVIRELFGLLHGEKILHTAHRTTTSHSAAVRLVKELDNRGYTEVQRMDKEKQYEKSYTFSKQFGLERIRILDENGGQIDFRTRSGKGGLGEGFDLLVVDEAQEYQDDHESALKYVVSDSANPQTIMCGTPPTAVSSGTVFVKYREKTLKGESAHSYWAEWAVEEQHDFYDREMWYETNPSLGLVLTERKIEDEANGDIVDFNIQRLGLWLKYSLKSAITEAQWKALELLEKPQLKGALSLGIKCGKESNNISLAVACKTADDKVFVEEIDSRPLIEGVDWVVGFVKGLKTQPIKIAFDGQQASSIVKEAFTDAKIKGLYMPTVQEYIDANAKFELALNQQTIIHSNQKKVAESVTNCEKRAIGSHGGFGYKSIKTGCDVGILDSLILAHWVQATFKETKKQQISY